MQFMSSFENQPYRTLDGLRGIAALIVMTRHLPDIFGQFTFPRCYLAVDLFFVLSGFVIANAYNARLSSGMGIIEFMRIRLIRFFPLYLLALGFGLIDLALEMYLPGGREWTNTMVVLAIVFGLLFLPTPSAPDGAFYPLNMPSWSLGFEIAINAFYALVYRWLSIKVIMAIIAISALGVLRYALYYGGMNYGDGWGDLIAGSMRVSYSFFAGILVWHWRGSRSMNTWTATAIGAVVALILMLQIDAMPFDLIMVLAVFPAIVWVAARYEPDAIIAIAYIKLGLASYGLYVLHTPIGLIIQRIAKANGYEIPISFVGIIFIVVLTFAVIWIDKYFDQPLRRILLHTTRFKGISVKETVT
jgi:peptidoglycan/LPS O-acetylase OafA/YrhL